MAEEILFHRGATLVRRLTLEPGEAMPWHRDPHNRLTVVLGGDTLMIEYQNDGPGRIIHVFPGQVDWDEPTDRLHRGINTGEGPYEGLTVFFMKNPHDIHQPPGEESTRS